MIFKKIVFVFYLIIGFTSISCIMIDDDVDAPTEEDLELSEAFLLGETWNLNAIYSDPKIDFNDNSEEKSLVLSSQELVNGEIVFDDQVNSCDRDNSYVFNEDSSTSVKLNFGNDICDIETNEAFEYFLDIEKETLVIPTLIKDLSYNGNFLSLYNVNFSQGLEGSKTKYIRANYDYVKNDVTYTFEMFFNN